MSQSEELAQLRQELRLAQREGELYRRLLALSRQEDLRPLLEEALGLIVEITQAQQGYLALYDEREEEPRWWIARGFSEKQAQSVQKKVSSGVIAAALATGETIINDAAEDPRFSANESVQALDIRAVLCAPIGLKAPIGVLYLQGKPSPLDLFTENDRLCAEIFSRQLAPLAERLRMKQTEGDPTQPFRKRLSLEHLSGQSAAMATLFGHVERASRFELTVLLRGPSGTGKTAIAKAIHQNSPRAKGPFLELNCATIPESLFESELFGALPGSHSTANKKLPGKLVAAEGGTLFLDEIGELPLLVQAKLLQLLQSKEYFPLGATKPEKANVRLIAATNVDLEEVVRQKKFREDLFYRLQVLTIWVPALSERREDIPNLVQHFCQKTCEQHGLGTITPGPEVLRVATISEWPGNVRQLANAVEVATISAAMESAPEILPRHLFPDVPIKEKHPSYQDAVKSFQRQFVLNTLNELNWNISETAKRLDLNRSYLHQLIQGLGLKRS